MEYSDFLPAIVAESSALADAARTVTFDARVPSCPEWDVAKLVRHTGTVQRWSNGVVRTREPLAHKAIDLEIPEEPSGLPDWLERGAADLAATLAEADPDAECWTWTTDHHVRFWARRMALETAVHRGDAQEVAGARQPIEGALAVEGIEEHLANLPSLAPAPLTGDGESLHLHCTDRPGEWLLRLGADGLEVSREHAKGDVALKGTASDLSLVLVGRIAVEAVDVFGDPDVLARWQTLMRF